MILSFELPFALIPLLKFSSSRSKMGPHKNSIYVSTHSPFFKKKMEENFPPLSDEALTHCIRENYVSFVVACSINCMHCLHHKNKIACLYMHCLHLL